VPLLQDTVNVVEKVVNVGFETHVHEKVAEIVPSALAYEDQPFAKPFYQMKTKMIFSEIWHFLVAGIACA